MKCRVEERLDIGRRIYNGEMTCQSEADLSLRQWLHSTAR